MNRVCDIQSGEMLDIFIGPDLGLAKLKLSDTYARVS